MIELSNSILQNGGVPEYLQETVASLVAFLPRLVGAIIILAVGWFLGKIAGRLVERFVDTTEIDRRVRDTPLGGILGGTERAVSHAAGEVTKWFVVAIAVLAAANVLAIALLSQWISTALAYLPAFIAGLLIIVLGFVVADFIGDAITRTRAATETAYTSWFATGTRMFLYFTAIVIGLDTMGIDVGILFVFARALAWGVAAAFAIGAGLAFGLGGREYVEDNIDRWMGKATQNTPAPQTGVEGSPTGGSDDD